MNFRSLMTILFGTALAGGASYAVMNFSDTGAGAAEAVEVPMQEVVVALSEINYGDVIDPRLLGTQAWPRESVPQGVFFDTDSFDIDGQPRRALANVFPGELILAAKVSEPGARVSLVQKLTPGFRAVAIKVSATTAVGGFVTPGDYVDVVMSQGSGANLRVVTILQKVKVIAVDQISQELQNQAIVARTVTVEVTPMDGQKLVLAEKAGDLSLSLRDLEAPDEELIPEISVGDLFAPEPEPEPAPEPEIVYVEVPVEVAPEPKPEPVDTRARITVRRGIDTEEVVVK